MEEALVGADEEETAAVSIGTHCREDERTLRDIVRSAAANDPRHHSDNEVGKRRLHLSGRRGRN